MTNDFTLNSLTWSGSLYGASGPAGSASKGILVGTTGHKGEVVFNIKGDLTLWGSSTTAERTYLRFLTRGKNDDLSTDIQACLNVDGNIYVGDATKSTYQTTLQIGGFGSAQGNTSFHNCPYYKFNVGGDVYMSANSTYLNLNVGFNNYASSLDYSNPDIEISGRIVGYQGIDSSGQIYTNANPTWSWSTIYLKYLSAGNSTTPVNDTSAGFKSILSVNGISGERISIKNNASTSEGNVYSALMFTNDSNAEMSSSNIIRDDEASGSAGFHNTSKVALVMNGKASQTIKIGGQFSGGVTVISGSLFLSSKDGNASKGMTPDGVLFTHGDLDMQGGTFGFYYDNETNSSGGSYSFNNVYWKSGTIQICAYDNGIDIITLDKVNGSGGEFLAGEGSVGDVVFNIVGDTYTLVNQEKQIVSWSGYDQSLSFSGNDIILFDQSYKPVFRADETGLYVTYTAIPEPAIFGLLAGVGAAALAMRARRKEARRP